MCWKDFWIIVVLKLLLYESLYQICTHALIILNLERLQSRRGFSKWEHCFFNWTKKKCFSFFNFIGKKAGGAGSTLLFLLPTIRVFSEKKRINPKNAPSAKNMYLSQRCIPQYWILIKDKVIAAGHKNEKKGKKMP